MRVSLPTARVCTLALLAAAGAAAAGTAVGDAGHYLSCDTQVHLNNPAGRAFHLTIHRFQWWIGGGWNQPEMKVRLTGPKGKVVVDKVCLVGDDGCRLDVPAGARGVYTFDVSTGNTLNFWYVESSLEQSVAWTGPTKGDAIRDRWFLCNPFVPRRWHFWVPAGTKRFVLRAENCRGRSQREDHGLTVLSPRGQRIAVLWGQAGPDESPATLGKLEGRVQQATILVEPGSAGRFWAIEVRMGDSHTYSDINLCLEGVPPYVARSPEEWFDPRTGKAPDVAPYDESEFVQSDRSPVGRATHPLVHHWTPCPALGDPDACELRCPARLALWNPEGRALKFVIGTYLPRNMFPGPRDRTTRRWPKLPDEQHDHADLSITGPGGRPLLKDRAPLKHLHGEPGYSRTLRTAKGVCFVDVTRAEHFWAYTYPATPAVLVGRPADGQWRRFHFDAGTARNWFFFVPKGTGSLSVRASVAHDTDVMHLEVGAPDRVLAILYGRRGERTVAVPPGLDGKIWHVRVDFGGATRFVSRLPRPRFPSLAVTLDLKGVPPYLAPTWEQWFDPRRPVPAGRRAGR